MGTAGIVLAAGASRRMGTPKALLRGADGVALAALQAAALRAGGCASVAVVAGAGADEVRAGLPPGLAVVENARWEQGRATSLQAGIAAFPDAEGYLFLPVDAPGTGAGAVRALLAAAAGAPDRLWRPTCGGRRGHMRWVPRAAAAELLRLPADARVDEWALPLARETEVADEGMLRNVNTPEAWADYARGASCGE